MNQLSMVQLATMAFTFMGVLSPANLHGAEPRSAASAKVITQPGAEYDDAHRTWQGIPSIERTRGGRMIVAWYSGGDGEGSIENYCLMAVSDDAGRTWTPPSLVIQGQKGEATAGPLPWLDPKGRLWLFWVDIHPDKALRGMWAIRCDEPDAATMQWSAPQFIGGGSVTGKPLILRDGTWLAPFDVRNDSPLAKRTGKNAAGVIASTDEGATWEWRGGWQLEEGVHDFCEHCVVERKDGSLWAVLRVKDGLMQSISTDDGKTWSALAPFMTGTRTRAHLRRLASGRLLLIYHDGPAQVKKEAAIYRREMLTAFLSDDGGKTWPRKLLLDSRNRVSYPDVTEGPNGRIFVTYDYSRYMTGCKEVLVLPFTEADILGNRTLPTPSVVNRATGFGNNQETRGGDEDKMREKVNQKLLEGKAAEDK
jgi:predicted neuraminidase